MRVSYICETTSEIQRGDPLQLMGKHTKKKQGKYSNEHKILCFTPQQELEASDEQQGLQ